MKQSVQNHEFTGGMQNHLIPPPPNKQNIPYATIVTIVVTIGSNGSDTPLEQMKLVSAQSLSTSVMAYNMVKNNSTSSNIKLVYVATCLHKFNRLNFRDIYS